MNRRRIAAFAAPVAFLMGAAPQTPPPLQAPSDSHASAPPLEAPSDSDGLAPPLEARSDSDGLAPPRGILFHTITADGSDIPAAVYVPRDLPADAPAPAILFLHGHGECGVDGTRQLTVGLPPAILAEPARWPFVVLIPQKPVGPAEWEDYDAHLMALLDLAAERYGVDPARIAVTGLSQGGHGAIAVAARHPDRFRAVAPVCGYVAPRFVQGDRRVSEPSPEQPEVLDAAASLAGTPVWLFHGGQDGVVTPDESRALHTALEQRGADATLTIFPDDNHNSWDSAYRSTDLAAWLAEHTRPR